MSRAKVQKKRQEILKLSGLKPRSSEVSPTTMVMYSLVGCLDIKVCLPRYLGNRPLAFQVYL